MKVIQNYILILNVLKEKKKKSIFIDIQKDIALIHKAKQFMTTKKFQEKYIYLEDVESGVQVGDIEQIIVLNLVYHKVPLIVYIASSSPLL